MIIFRLNKLTFTFSCSRSFSLSIICGLDLTLGSVEAVLSLPRRHLAPSTVLTQEQRRLHLQLHSTPSTFVSVRTQTQQQLLLCARALFSFNSRDIWSQKPVFSKALLAPRSGTGEGYLPPLRPQNKGAPYETVPRIFRGSERVCSEWDCAVWTLTQALVGEVFLFFCLKLQHSLILFYLQLQGHLITISNV